MRGLPRERPGTRARYRRCTAVLAAVVIACATGSLGAGGIAPASAAARLKPCAPVPPGLADALAKCFGLTWPQARATYDEITSFTPPETSARSAWNRLSDLIQSKAGASAEERMQIGKGLMDLSYLSRNGLQPTCFLPLLKKMAGTDAVSTAQELQSMRFRLDTGRIEPGSQFLIGKKEGTLNRRGKAPVKLTSGDKDANGKEIPGRATDPDGLYIARGGIATQDEVIDNAGTYKDFRKAGQHKGYVEWGDGKFGLSGDLPRANDLHIIRYAGWTQILYGGKLEESPDFTNVSKDPTAPINQWIKDRTTVQIGGRVFTREKLEQVRASVESSARVNVRAGKMSRAQFATALDKDITRKSSKLGIKYPEDESPKPQGTPTQGKKDQDKAKKAERKNAENLGCKGQPAVGMARGSVLAAMPMAAAACPVQKQQLSGMEQALQNPGGIDFTSLGLRYMSDDPGSGGVQYAFSGKAASPGVTQNTDTGVDAVTNSTADLRTWLVLSPQTFWVNLNPSQPDKIVDAKLGETNAGRALLDADLRLKQTSAKLTNPKTSLGARYWKTLGTGCYSDRLWIVPGDVQVRQDGSSLYVLRADLSVKTQTINIDNAGKNSCHPDPATAARMEPLERNLLLPKVIKAVNTEKAYAPLRRAFLARIVAQWIRDRHAAGERTSFDDLLGSGNLGPAVLTDGWRPRQVFDAYVHEVKDGAFTYKKTVRVGNRLITQIETVGGVDFSKLNPSRIGAAQMQRQHPHLAQTVRTAATRPANDSDGTIWLGATVPEPDPGFWAGATGTISDFVTSRTGILVLVVVALGVLTFGIRGGRRRRPAS